MKTRSLLLILSLILFVGCNKKVQNTITQGEALMQVWESGNTDELSSIMTEDAEYEAAQQLYTFKGLEEIGGYIKHTSSFAKDLNIEVLAVKASKNFAAIEWIMTGIQDRPIPGRVNAATNKSFTLKGTTIIELEKGKITKATDYMDVLGFLLQLGARVEIPGGVVLGGMKAPNK